MRQLSIRVAWQKLVLNWVADFPMVGKAIVGKAGVVSRGHVQSSARSQDGELTGLWLSIWVGIASGLYFVLRYRGLWGEVDSSIFTQIIDLLPNWNRIEYPFNYTHGYAYSVWAASLSMVWNVDVTQLQRWVIPLIGNIFLAVFGYVTFKRWLGSYKLGLLAATSLFLVPELIFTVSRGNHEKLTATLTLLASLSFLRIFQLSKSLSQWSVVAGWVVVYYLIVFTLVSLNAFFGSLFVYASLISYGLASVVLWFYPVARRELRPVMRRLALFVTTSLMVLFVVQWYVYSHEGESSRILSTIIEGFGTVRETGEANSDPYALVQNDWVSRRAYNIVSSFRFVLLGISFLTWLVLLIRALTRLHKTSVARLFLLTLYGAFGMLLALGVAIDFLGLAAGSNWQVRIYTYFSAFAVPLFVLGIYWLRAFLGRFMSRELLKYIFSTLMIGFVVCSLLKATLDPIVSNRWIAYKFTEVRAINFWLDNRGDDTLFIGDIRLFYGYAIHYGGSPTVRSYLETGVSPRAPHLIRSTVNSANAVAWRRPVSAILLDDWIYDNGETQIVHRIPRTPFQQ